MYNKGISNFKLYETGVSIPTWRGCPCLEGPHSAPFAISFFSLPTFPSKYPPMALLLSLPHILATFQLEFHSQSDAGIISHILEGVRFRVKQPQERDRLGSLGVPRKPFGGEGYEGLGGWGGPQKEPFPQCKETSVYLHSQQKEPLPPGL